MSKLSLIICFVFFYIGGFAHADGNLRNVTISKTSNTALCAVQSALNQKLNGSQALTITSLGGGRPGQFYSPSALFIFFSAKDSSGKPANYNLVLFDINGDIPWIWNPGNQQPSAFGDPVSTSADLIQIDEPDVYLQWKPYLYLGSVDISKCN